MKLQTSQRVNFTKEEAEAIIKFGKILEDICRSQSNGLVCENCPLAEGCPINHVNDYNGVILGESTVQMLYCLSFNEGVLFPDTDQIPDFLRE